VVNRRRGGSLRSPLLNILAEDRGGEACGLQVTERRLEVKLPPPPHMGVIPEGVDPVEAQLGLHNLCDRDPAGLRAVGPKARLRNFVPEVVLSFPFAVGTGGLPEAVTIHMKLNPPNFRARHRAS